MTRRSRQRHWGAVTLIMQLYAITEPDACELSRHISREVEAALRHKRDFNFNIPVIFEILSKAVPSEKVHTVLNSLLDPRGRVIETIVTLKHIEMTL